MASLVKIVAAIPGSHHNLVTNPGFEVNTTGWAGLGNTTLGRANTAPDTDTWHATMTAVGAGNMLAGTSSGLSGFPVTAEHTYTLQMRLRAATTVRTCRAVLNWYDSAGVFISNSVGTNASNATGAYTTFTVTGTAPATGFARVDASVLSAAAGEVHYLDSVMLERLGTVSTYGDGSSAGWEWGGTAHASASREAATVRLDLHDGTVWKCVSFDAPPPRLRRAVANNAMGDGVHVSSSTYDARVLTLELHTTKTTQDLAATELQKLARELDRTDNYLMYQPDGASKPVFFRFFRSELTEITTLRPGSASPYRAVKVELLAEPFALGLRETLGPFTVNNDPAAASNGCFFDVTNVIGDAAALPVLVNSTARRYAGILSTRAHGTPANVTHFVQAESLTLLTDTVNPGGGPDAAMSGTGTNNFVRTTFGTQGAMTQRLVWTPAAGVDNRGPFAIYAVVRRSDSTSDMAVALQHQASGAHSSKVALPKSTFRILVRIGVDGWSEPPIDSPGGLAGTVAAAPSIGIAAERTSGAGTLDWDVIFRLPVDRQTLMWQTTVADDTGLDMVIDGGNESLYVMTSGVDVFAGGVVQPEVFGATGSFPTLVPNQTNRVYLLTTNTASGRMDKTVSDSIAVHYWPQYLSIRPSAT